MPHAIAEALSRFGDIDPTEAENDRRPATKRRQFAVQPCGRQLAIKRHMKVVPVMADLEPVFLEAVVVKRKRGEGCCGRQPGLLVEFAAGGISDDLTGFDGPPRHLQQHIRKVRFVENEKPVA
jgi:hypothetical protein